MRTHAAHAATPADAGARPGIKAARSGAQSKAERLNAARQQREQKRAAVLEARRTAGPPRVVALLPLSADVDAPRLWAALLGACSAGDEHGKAASSKADGGMELDTPGGAAANAATAPMAMTTLALHERRRTRFTFLPPPAARDDPLAIVELARSAEVGPNACRGGAGRDAHLLPLAGCQQLC